MTNKNRVAIVTGAGSGIGRAIAHGLAAEGARVVVSDVDEAGGADTVAAIEKAGGTATFVRADVSKPGDGEALVGSAVQEFGALHVAVNNAGIGGPSAPIGDYPIDGWDRVIAINLSGVFYGMRYQIPALLDSGGGSIVNVASILGQVGFANSAAYVAAKHGVVGLTRSAAIEYAARGVRVNAIGPAFINTPLIEKNMTPEARAGLVAKHPIGRLGEPEEVAELVVWLSSDKASFVNGSYYAIDGGYLAQ
ncbi:MAG TPA: glucose 1-dehydrogenase [Gemmatimonadota bacterium]|nr:glucose 1-dehydrogenase [Gemmatimonadota bacterium]